MARMAATKKSKITMGILALFIGVLFLCPLTAYAADTDIYSIDITATLKKDGSATITEIWDVNCKGDMTEWYVAKINLDNQEISNLQVSDETGQEYQQVEDWDVEASLEEKSGKCGILETTNGYELCWGIGSFDKHTFTVTYDVTNMVKGYADADGLYQEFIKRGLSAEPEHIQITIRGEDVEFTQENTGVWAFGRPDDMAYGVENGQVVMSSDKGLTEKQYATLLIEFKKGMFEPSAKKSESFNDVLAEAKQGSDYGEDYNDDTSDILGIVIPIVLVVGIFAAFMLRSRLWGSSSGGVGGKMGQMRKEYKEAEYSRAIPWQGNLPATYTRLYELRKLPNEGTIIGAYFLRWIRSRQVAITTEQGGYFQNKDATAILLYDARDGMTPLEQHLYEMLVSAAGPDRILQAKEFERWSKKHYASIQGWLERYRNLGSQEMRNMNAITEVPGKAFFGMVDVQKTELSPLGEQLTVEMFGFKKYLKDFTLINERQAREVELWDDYLIFAQVYGIAGEVADQFKKLYPDYFTQMARDLGMRPDLFDIIILTNLANSYGRAMNDGYRAGYSAHVNRDSGGGGFASGGGGFGASGGGGFGGGGR